MKYLMCPRDVYGDYENREEYYEIDSNGYVNRLVYIFPNAVVTSREHSDPLVPCTTIEHPIDQWDRTGLVETSKDVFEDAWNRPDPRQKPVRTPLQKKD